MGIGSHQSHRMLKDEWLTPPEIIESLGPFDLDPCAPVNPPWKMADRHYTIKDNGLMQPWAGRVWCILRMEKSRRRGFDGWPLMEMELPSFSPEPKQDGFFQKYGERPMRCFSSRAGCTFTMWTEPRQKPTPAVRHAWLLTEQITSSQSWIPA